MKTRVIIVSFLIIIGCGRGDLSLRGYDFPGNTEVLEEELLIAPVSGQETGDGSLINQEKPDPRKIVKNGYLEIKTPDINASRKLFDTLMNQYNGYLSSERFEDQNSRWGYYLTIRILSSEFDSFLASIEKGPGRVVEKTISSSDVTEEYYDIRTRLNNNRSLETRYLELLGKATTVKDILEIEKSLGEVRGEIETQQGKINRLDNQVSYSTLDIYLTQRKPFNEAYSDREPFVRSIGISLWQGWRGLVDFIVVLFKIWPLWMGGLLIWRLAAYLNKRKKIPGDK